MFWLFIQRDGRLPRTRVMDNKYKAVQSKQKNKQGK